MHAQRYARKTRLQLALTAGICVLLSACGAGSGNNDSNANSGPSLDVAASSPGLEISLDVPASTASATTTSNATGYAVFDGASNYFIPSPGGNPDGLQQLNYNSASGRLDVAVDNTQAPGIYRLAVNAQDSAGDDSGELFEVLVYPDGQANMSSGYSANLTATTEVSFNNNSTNVYTADVIIPPRLNITYPPSQYSASNFTFGIPMNPPAVTPTGTDNLSADGITINNIAVDSSDDLVLNITVDPTRYGAMNDINPSPRSGGFLLQMNVNANFNHLNPDPYMEVFYVTPNVAL